MSIVVVLKRDRYESTSQIGSAGGSLKHYLNLFGIDVFMKHGFCQTMTQ